MFRILNRIFINTELWIGKVHAVEIRHQVTTQPIQISQALDVDILLHRTHLRILQGPCTQGDFYQCNGIYRHSQQVANLLARWRFAFHLRDDSKGTLLFSEALSTKICRVRPLIFLPSS